MHHRSTALFGSISYFSVVNNGRCDVSRGQGQGVEVETRTKQSPHGCIADDGSVRVKTECRPGVIRLDIGSIRGSKINKFQGSCGVLWISCPRVECYEQWVSG